MQRSAGWELSIHTEADHVRLATTHWPSRRGQPELESLSSLVFSIRDQFGIQSGPYHFCQCSRLHRRRSLT
jgi:hypothetical protein